MNLALYRKGEDRILFFIIQAIVKEGMVVGENFKLKSNRLDELEFKWTLDIARFEFVEESLSEGKTVFKKRWLTKISELTPALTYKDQVVSNREDINTITKAEIRKQYSLEDELKLQRQRDILPIEFKTYSDFVEGLRAEGRAFKDKYFAEEK